MENFHRANSSSTAHQDLLETSCEKIQDLYFDKLLLEYCAFKDKGDKCPFNEFEPLITDFAYWASTKRERTFKFVCRMDVMKFIERVHRRFPLTFPSHVQLIKLVQDDNSSIISRLKDIERTHRSKITYSSYRDLIESEFRK